MWSAELAGRQLDEQRRAARRTERFGEALAVLELAAKLNPADAATRYRCGRLMRQVAGRLQEAIEHFNGCLVADERYPGAADANSEAMRTMRALQDPKPGWQEVAGNLGAVLVLLAALTHFFTP